MTEMHPIEIADGKHNRSRNRTRMAAIDAHGKAKFEKALDYSGLPPAGREKLPAIRGTPFNVLRTDAVNACLSPSPAQRRAIAYDWRDRRAADCRPYSPRIRRRGGNLPPAPPAIGDSPAAKRGKEQGRHLWLASAGKTLKGMGVKAPLPLAGGHMFPLAGGRPLPQAGEGLGRGRGAGKILFHAAAPSSITLRRNASNIRIVQIEAL
jgi:hypothetical protein